MCLAYFKRAWEVYRKNFWPILGVQAAYGMIVFGILLLSMIPLVSAGFMALIASASPEALANNLFFAPQLAGAIKTFMLGMLLAAVSAIVLDSGRIGVYRDALKGRDVRVQTMFSIAKEKFWTSLGATAIIIVLIFAAAFALVLLTTALFGATSSYLPYLLLFNIVIIILFALFFLLVKQAIVIDNLGAKDAVKKSYGIVRNNYSKIAMLLAAILIAWLALTELVPLGRLIVFLVLSPVADLAYTTFYLEKAGTAVKTEEKKAKPKWRAGRRSAKRKRRR